MEHYDQFDLQAATMALMPRVALQLPPAARQELFGLVAGGANDDGETPDAEQVAAVLDVLDLEPVRHEVIELLIHGSNVLEMIPEGYEDWIPIVHDSFLAVMSGMSIERIRDRVADQAELPADAGRGERLLAFGAETPTFQKIGQIVGRYSWVPEDLGTALETLESDIVTTDADSLVAIAERELGGRIDEYRIRFEDEVLSEASVGAIIGATMVPPGETEPRRVVAKIIKAYAVEAIDEDLESIDRLLALLEQNREFYGIGATPLVDMFQELKSALSREVRAADERANLARAGEFFSDDPRVVVPELCACSTANVTIMERIEGIKVTDAFPEEPERRTELAERLADILMFDVLFGAGNSLFHGDPHAGNVFSVATDEDPYRIALIDWGLQGSMSHQKKVKLVQVGLGLQLKHADRLRDNMDMLLEEPIDIEADREVVDGVIDRVFAAADEAKAAGEDPGTLTLLDALVAELARAGYTVDGDMLLYVKSLVTIVAVMSDLDAEFSAGEHMAGRVKGQIFSEMPKRLANTVWIPGMWSHDYASMASNNDVWASSLNSIGLGFKSLGVGIWRGISFPFSGADEPPATGEEVGEEAGRSDGRYF